MGDSLSRYIRNIKCAKGLDGIITAEHRTNNLKRDYLFCNKIQGKHIPVDPNISLDLFDELRYVVEKEIHDYRVLVIGFAETATAIGAALSSGLSCAVYYLQTTRENCSPIEKLIEFSEEHSHATEQFIYGDMDAFPTFDYVLFVEDEISTGKTILNFITELKKIKHDIHFGVASICNWQSDTNKEKFKELEIDVFALIYGELIDANAKMGVKIREIENEFSYDKYSKEFKCPKKFNQNTVHAGFFTPFILERTGRHPSSLEYDTLIKEVLPICMHFTSENERVLILGTEEFMYFPMIVGEHLENINRKVKLHATTRSSIDVMENSSSLENEIVNKFKIHSAYDENRETYIYNLRDYDKVIIISDGDMGEKFKLDMVYALMSVGNKENNIKFIRLTK